MSCGQEFRPLKLVGHSQRTLKPRELRLIK